MENLTPDSVAVKPSHVAYQVIEGEAVVLDIPGRTLRGLNPVGSRIYQLVDGKRTIGDITKTIMEEFECDEEGIIEDVRAFLEELREKNLVTIESRSP